MVHSPLQENLSFYKKLFFSLYSFFLIVFFQNTVMESDDQDNLSDKVNI